MFELFFESVLCRGLFPSNSNCKRRCFFLVLTMISGFFSAYNIKVLRPAASRMKKNTFSGHLRAFHRHEYVTIILSNVSTAPFVALYDKMISGLFLSAFTLLSWCSVDNRMTALFSFETYETRVFSFWKLNLISCNTRFLFFWNCGGMALLLALIVPTSVSFFSHNLSAKGIEVKKLSVVDTRVPSSQYFSPNPVQHSFQCSYFVHFVQILFRRKPEHYRGKMCPHHTSRNI